MSSSEKILVSCVFCKSNHIVTSGHIPSGIQVWKCKSCNRRFRAVRTFGKGRKLTIEHKEKLKTHLPIDKLRQDYLELTMPMRVIAMAYGCKYETVRRNLQDNNVPIRTVAEQCRTKYTRQHRSHMAIGNQHTLGYKHTTEARNIMTIKCRERMAKPSERLKLSKALLKLWANPIHKNKQQKLMRLGLHIKPNKPEAKLQQILDKYWSNQWKYVGDGEVVICGRNPDFINVNGEKSVILLHGIYWHLSRKQEENPELTKEQVEQEDINFYKIYGWKCLVVWDKELNNTETLTIKIGEFVGEYK